MLATRTRHSTQLHWQCTGSGQPLVLIHGWGMHSGLWGPFRDVLAQHYRVLTVDLPGCGASRAMAWPTHIQALAELIVTDFTEPAIWLGWSLGGLVATAIAARYPEQVQRLILIASNPCFLAQNDWPGMAPTTLQDFQQRLTLDTDKTLRQFFQLQCLGLPQAGHTFQQLQHAWKTYPPADQQTLLGGMHYLSTCDQRTMLSQLAMPCLMLWGALDRIVPVATSAAMAKLAPHIQHHTLYHAAHMPFFTHQQTCIEMIGSWLS